MKNADRYNGPQSIQHIHFSVIPLFFVCDVSMYVRCVNVHAICQCTCDVSMYVRCVNVHAMCQCTCDVSMYVRCVNVHATYCGLFVGFWWKKCLNRRLGASSDRELAKETKEDPPLAF
jgi:hypothetical protein